MHRASVYVNNRYYILEPTPITIKTDGTGGIVIVEAIENLQGTCFQVHGDDGSIISINPMDKPMQRVANLNSKDNLTAATIKNPDGSTKPLIDSTTSDTDKQNVVDSLGTLKTVYDSLPSDGSVKSSAAAAPQAFKAVPRANVMSFATPNASMAFSGRRRLAFRGRDCRQGVSLRARCREKSVGGFGVHFQSDQDAHYGLDQVPAFPFRLGRLYSHEGRLQEPDGTVFQLPARWPGDTQDRSKRGHHKREELCRRLGRNQTR